MSALRLVIFDCDGTLVDSQAAIGQSMEQAFKGIGLPYPGVAAVRQVVGLSLHDAAKKLLAPEHHHLAGPLEVGYRDAFAALRAEDRVHEPLYEGVLETLQTLASESILMGIATGKGLRGLEKTLAGHGIADYFVTLQTADQHPGKPHPAMLQAALSETGADKANAVIVGDTTFDMMMGANAGVKGLGVSWGYHEPGALQASGAAAILKSMDEVVHHALRLGAL